MFSLICIPCIGTIYDCFPADDGQMDSSLSKSRVYTIFGTESEALEAIPHLKGIASVKEPMLKKWGSNTEEISLDRL